MNGKFDVQLIGNRGLDDRAFQRAIDGGYIMDLLGDLPLQKHCPREKNDNMIFDNYAEGMMRLCLSGPTPAHGYWDECWGDSNNAALSRIGLATTSSLPTYTEDFSSNHFYSLQTTNHTPDSANTSSGGKRFIEDDITAPTIWSDTDREAVHFRNRFLYLPSQGNSSSIRSISIHLNKDADQSLTASGSTKYSCKIGRVRLRDANGVLTTLNKTSSNSLIVEYTFTLVSW